MQDQYAGLENAGLKNGGNDIVWNTLEHGKAFRWTAGTHNRLRDDS